MNPGSAVTREVQSLIEAVCDGMADDAQVRDLESLLLTDEETCNFYVDLLDLDAKLQWLTGSLQEGEAAFKELIAAEQTPPQQPTPTFPATLWHGTVGFLSSGWPVAYLVATVICGVSMFIGSLVPTSQPVQLARQSSVPSRSVAEPKTELVGRITGMVDCQWAESPKSEIRNPKQIGNHKSEIINPDSLVSLGDRFALASGLMEITYDTGAKVILQGPVTYEVESNGGYLAVGKLTGRLGRREEGREERGEGTANHQSSIINHQSPNPQSLIPNPPSLSTIHYPLFTIKTPTATVTDLGTEFGVEVRESGATSAHVFRGVVEVRQVAKDGKHSGQAVRLIENESVQVIKDGDNKRLIVRHVSADPRVFVRQLIQPPTIVDLLDIVAGGNGAGHHRERGIDPCSGMEDPMFLATGRPGDGKYHRAPYFSMINGVFIPDGSQGPVQIDSAGHAFNFPKTQGESVGPIWAGAADVRLESLKKDANYWLHSGKFGKEFMPEHRGLLGMHSNAGITFDLDAIRKIHGGWKSGRFRATAGKDLDKLADLWVLVDGRLEWKALQITGKSGVSRVDVAIKPDDRFLTLVSTDGGEGRIGGCWTVFGDPVLEPAASDPEKKGA